VFPERKAINWLFICSSFLAIGVRDEKWKKPWQAAVSFAKAFTFFPDPHRLPFYIGWPLVANSI
jgi:hypothetical protein